MYKIRDEVKLELEDIGEGLSGEFDEDDPNDIPLLRLVVSVRGRLRAWYEHQNGELSGDETWGDVPKGSYCTSIVATASSNDQAKFLDNAMDQLYQLVLVDRFQSALRQLTWQEAGVV